jgi:heme exporter protein CcmD
MSETLAMGGYGAYVWSSVGLTVIVLVLCAVLARRRHRSILHDIRVQSHAMEVKE